MGVGLGGARCGGGGRRAARLAPRRLAAGLQPARSVDARPADLPAGARRHGDRDLPDGGGAMTRTLTHLERLEAESIQIMREAVAESERPVMLYSVGKDSSVMLHLARKAFHPSPPPFPLLHVDTTCKFRAMYAMFDLFSAEPGI